VCAATSMEARAAGPGRPDPEGGLPTPARTRACSQSVITRTPGSRMSSSSPPRGPGAVRRAVRHRTGGPYDPEARRAAALDDEGGTVGEVFRRSDLSCLRPPCAAGSSFALLETLPDAAPPPPRQRTLLTALNRPRQ
jgi:hypothetical protein